MTRTLSFLCLLAALLGAPVGRATTMVALDWPQLLTLSTVAGVGEVLSVNVRTTNGRVWTTAEVQFTRPIKGASAGDVVTLFLPGGVDGEIAQRIEGTPQLQPGDRRLFFLAPGPGGRLRIVGLEQGAASVRPDPSIHGGWVVQRPLSSHQLGVPLPQREPLLPLLDRLSTPEPRR